jgi:hypothetical protein
MAQRGVLMAVVPGAGGADALIALILPTAAGGLDDTRQRVGAVWRGWDSQPDAVSRAPVCELLVRESKPKAARHNGLQLEGLDAEAMLRRAASSLHRRSHSPRRTTAAALAVPLLAVAVGAAVVLALSRRR